MWVVSSISFVNSPIFYLHLETKGVSANMLKISSKRRRPLKQIKAEKEAAAQLEAEK